MRIALAGLACITAAFAIAFTFAAFVTFQQRGMPATEEHKVWKMIDAFLGGITMATFGLVQHWREEKQTLRHLLVGLGFAAGTIVLWNLAF